MNGTQESQMSDNALAANHSIGIDLEKMLLKRKEKYQKSNQRRREKYRNDLCKRELIKARNNEWFANNKEKVNRRHKRYYNENREAINIKIRASNKLLTKEQREVINARQREWYRRNKETQAEKMRTRRNDNIAKKLNNNISTALRHSIKGNKAGRRWESLVGYTVHDVKQHLESLFTSDMGWDDFLKGKIHIDHKRPVISFSFANPEDFDFKLCWSLSNLQPLWAVDNLKKGARF